MDLPITDGLIEQMEVNLKINKTILSICIGVALVTGIFFTLYKLTSKSFSGESVIIEASEGFLPSGGFLLGHEAEDFELPTIDGSLIRLSDQRGKPVLLNFGATWCQPCREEAPIMQKLHLEFPDLVVLMVDIDEDPAVVKNFADSFGLTFPIAIDEGGKVATEYGFVVIPTIFFIDVEGTVQGVLDSGSTEEEIRAYLTAIGIGP